MDNVDNLVSYILSSPSRVQILQSLGKKKMTANEISKQCSVSYTYGWKLLQGLKDRNIVNHNDVYRNHLYFLTELGQQVLLEVEER